MDVKTDIKAKKKSIESVFKKDEKVVKKGESCFFYIVLKVKSVYMTTLIIVK